MDRVILRNVCVKGEFIDLEVSVNENGDLEIYPLDDNFDFSDIHVELLGNVLSFQKAWLD